MHQYYHQRSNTQQDPQNISNTGPRLEAIYNQDNSTQNHDTQNKTETWPCINMQLCQAITNKFNKLRTKQTLAFYNSVMHHPNNINLMKYH